MSENPPSEAPPPTQDSAASPAPKPVEPAADARIEAQRAMPFEARPEPPKSVFPETPRPSPGGPAAPPSPRSAPPAATASTPPVAAKDDEDDDDEDDDEDDERDARRRRTSYPPPGSRPSDSGKRPGFEGLFRDSIRKAVERGLEVGIGTLRSADQVVNKVADEVKLPKEVSNYLFSQIDETKNVLIRAVAGEVRDFLHATDISTELQRALTALSFEVRMEIRFIPNDKGELKPEVKARAAPRARRRRDEEG